VGVLLVVVFFASGGACSVYAPVCGGSQTVRATFANANQLTWGQEVRLGGRKVGEIKSVEAAGGNAVVELKITDDQAWPLRRGTIARARFGSTTSYSWRYIELLPGPASAGVMEDGGVLSREETVNPFEYDETFRIMRGRTDDDLRASFTGLGDTLAGRGDDLGRALRDAPGGLDETSRFVRELGASERALRTLLVAGDRTTTALAERDDELQGLVSGAAETFDELAENADEQQAALDRLPRTLRTTTTTLGRVDVSLVLLDALLDDLRPGAAELRRLADPLRGALAELRRVTPLAADAFGRGTEAAPELTRLLNVGTEELPLLGTVLGQLQPIVGCLRPYGPEIAGTLGAWAGFGMNVDEFGHYIHGTPLQVNPLLPTGTSMNSQEIVEASGGRLRYAFPRPPGLNASQGIGPDDSEPFFQPQCGAGPESLDPSKDPEGAGR